GDTGDLAFLEKVFHKLMLNFTWWVNRKDAQGRNIFQGGFLGLDNIGVFDRSAPLPTGGFINQADGTSWMAMYALTLMRIALEPELLDQLPGFAGRLQWMLEHRSDLAELVSRWKDRGQGERHLLSLLRGHRMKCLLRRMLDETEFLNDYGVRALSKVHEREPY